MVVIACVCVCVYVLLCVCVCVCVCVHVLVECLHFIAEVVIGATISACECSL